METAQCNKPLCIRIVLRNGFCDKHQTWSPRSRPVWSQKPKPPTVKKCCRTGCGVKPLAAFSKNKTSRDGLHDECKTCMNAQRAGKLLQIKKAVIAAYGGECACCGEKETAFLTVEHAFGDGGKRRRELGGGGRRVFTDLVVRCFPADEGIEILCLNCNIASNHGKVCPHQRGENAKERKDGSPEVRLVQEPAKKSVEHEPNVRGGYAESNTPPHYPGMSNL